VANFRVFPGGDDLNRSDFTNLRARSDICDQRRRASNDAAIPISVAAINQQTIPKPITIITTATRRPPTPHAPLLGISQGRDGAAEPRQKVCALRLPHDAVLPGIVGTRSRLRGMRIFCPPKRLDTLNYRSR